MEESQNNENKEFVSKSLKFPEELVSEKKAKLKEGFNFEKLYNKTYKILLVMPLVILVLCLVYIYSFSQEHGDFIAKDISLAGGTSIQVNADDFDIADLRSNLENSFEELTVREIKDITTGKKLAFIVESSASEDDLKSFLEGYLGFQLTSENSSVEFTGGSLSQSFYSQLRFAMILSFILMAIIVFIIFRSFIPSTAVVFASFADIAMTIAVVDYLGMKVSSAGVVAFLMLIGYSVDTDILLTIRVIKRKEGSVNSRIFGAFKTGMTMTITSLIVVAVGFALTYSFSKIFSQIFTIILIGLLFDIMNTWLFNASLVKWYIERK